MKERPFSKLKTFLEEQSMYMINNVFFPINKTSGNIYGLGNFGQLTLNGIVFEQFNQYNALYFFNSPTEEQLTEAINLYDENYINNKFQYELEKFYQTKELNDDVFNFIKEGKTNILEDAKVDKNSKKDVAEYLFYFDRYMQVRKEMYLAEGNKPEILIGLRNDKGITKELVDSVIDTMTKLQEQGREVDVVCCTKIKKDLNDQTPYIYTPEEFEILKPLNEWCLQNKNKPLHFSESTLGVSKEDTWNYDQVKHANEQIDEVCKEIKDRNLSPFEAVLFVHDKATDFAYSESAKNYESRTLPGLFSENKIVCVGYSHYVKAIFDRLHKEGLMEGIKKVEINPCMFNKTTKEALQDDRHINANSNEHKIGHVNNIIEINDPKYGISGTYRLDACWDSREGEIKKPIFGHCLFPMNDVNSYKGTKYKEIEPETMTNLDTKGFTIKQGKRFKNSTPISLKQYFDGLDYLYKDKITDSVYRKAVVSNILEESRETIKSRYGKNAKNCFARCSVDEIQMLQFSGKTMGM